VRTLPYIGKSGPKAASRYMLIQGVRLHSLSVGGFE
jgi:hypothetical protein